MPSNHLEEQRRVFHRVGKRTDLIERRGEGDEPVATH